MNNDFLNPGLSGGKPTGTIEDVYEALKNFDEDGFMAAPPPKPVLESAAYPPQRGKIAQHGEKKAAIVKTARKLLKLIREIVAENRGPFDF
jgi:hypothetical protein